MRATSLLVAAALASLALLASGIATALEPTLYHVELYVGSGSAQNVEGRLYGWINLTLGEDDYGWLWINCSGSPVYLSPGDSIHVLLDTPVNGDAYSYLYVEHDDYAYLENLHLYTLILESSVNGSITVGNTQLCMLDTDTAEATVNLDLYIPTINQSTVWVEVDDAEVISEYEYNGSINVYQATVAGSYLEIYMAPGTIWLEGDVGGLEWYSNTGSGTIGIPELGPGSILAALLVIPWLLRRSTILG